MNTITYLHNTHRIYEYIKHLIHIKKRAELEGFYTYRYFVSYNVKYTDLGCFKSGTRVCLLPSARYLFYLPFFVTDDCSSLPCFY